MTDQTTPAEDELAIVGRVRKAHGIRGELVVEPYTNEPAAVFAAGRRLFGGTPDGRPLADAAGAPRALTVRRSSPFKEGLIVAVDELVDRTGAEAWRERTLLAPLAELPPPGDDEVYLHELVGMRVALADGTVLGEVVDYYELPHELLLEVRVPTPPPVDPPPAEDVASPAAGAAGADEPGDPSSGEATPDEAAAADAVNGGRPAKKARTASDTVLLPYRPEVVVEVDTGARVLTVSPPEGLFG